MSGSRPNQDARAGRHAGYLGAGFVAACAVVVLCTVWFLPATKADKTVAAAFAGAAIISVAGLTRLPWQRWPAMALLAYPVVGLGAMTAAALLTHGIGPVYTGFFAAGFVYIGLTQSSRMTLGAVVVAVPAWILCQDSLSTIVWVKLPISLGVWVLIGHNLAIRTALNAKRTGELELAASTDPLTGLLSRRELEHVLERLNERDAVILLDIDHFKCVNDEQGHSAGDLVLAALGHAIRFAMRTGDLALRYGGDEVLLVLSNASSAGADAMLDRLRERWSCFPYPTFSAGVAIHDGRPPKDTMDRADEALYVAKREGRGRWQLQDAKDHGGAQRPSPQEHPSERVLAET